MSGPATQGDEIAREALAGWKRAKPPPTHMEFARTLWVPNMAPPPASLPFDPMSDPIQRWLIEQFDSGRWERFYICAPPQFGGKTLVAVMLPALRGVIACRASVGYALPTLADLDKAWATKIKKAIKDSGYGEYLPKHGPGAKGGRGPTIQFHDPDSGEPLGEFVFMAGGAYGNTVRIAVLDEVDQFRDHAGMPLWNDIEDIFNRANAYRSLAVRIASGTVEHDTNSIILVLVNEHGTGTRPWPKCQHCGRHQVLDWDSVTYDPESDASASETARIACRHCGVLWSENDRRVAIGESLFVHKGQDIDEHGRINGPDPRTSKLGLLWTALDSVRADLGEIAKEHRLARLGMDRGDTGLMAKWERYRLCRGSVLAVDGEGQPHRINTTYLESRSNASGYAIARNDRVEDGDSIHAAQCPDDVEFLVSSADVQRGGDRAPGRLYFLIQGWRNDGTTWDVAWGSIAASPIGRQPNTAELHIALDRLHAFISEYAQSVGKPIVRRVVDVGDRQDELVQWIIRNAGWHAVRGGAGTMKAEDGDLAGWIYIRQQNYMGAIWHLGIIDVDQARNQAQVAFLVPANKPGAAHLPSGLNRNDAIIRHYCGTARIRDDHGRERWSETKQDRKYHHEWQKRHDYLDCRTYAYVAGYHYREIMRKRAAADQRAMDAVRRPQPQPHEHHDGGRQINRHMRRSSILENRRNRP